MDDEYVMPLLADLRASIDHALRECGTYVQNDFIDGTHVGLVSGDVDTGSLAESILDEMLDRGWAFMNGGVKQ